MKKALKYVHIYDDDKITEASIKLFLEFNAENQAFIILAHDTLRWDKYIEEHSNFKVLIIGGDLQKKLKEEIAKHDVIFFHPLSFVKAKFLSSFKSSKQVFVWVLWGYDLYNIANYFGFNDDYGTTVKRTGLKAKIQDYYSYKVIYKKAIQKIDMCYFLLEEDFNLLSSLVKHKAVWRSNIYPTLDYYIDHLSSHDFDGDSILIGNSSTPSNKHQYIFSKLEKIDFNNRKLICPLSYGENAYRDSILKIGTEKFGDTFTPITDFIPLKEYMDIVRSCSHAIMPHDRQQAFGTIVILLYFGCKVFLSTESPIYGWLKVNGIKIYCAEKDLELEINSSLDSSTIATNRKHLEKLLSNEAFSENQKAIMDKCYSLWINKN